MKETYKGFEITVTQWLNDSRLFVATADNEQLNLETPDPVLGAENALKWMKELIDEELK